MELLRIGELAKRSGVPIATLKFYLREGLIAPARKSGRTMAWYEPSTVDRIRAIRELQERQFLPLDVIRETIDSTSEAADDHAIAEGIAEVLIRRGGKRTRSRAEVLSNGAKEAELEWLQRAGLAVPDADGSYRGDDLALLQTLGAARRSGLGAEMLPFEILGDYLGAINKLVEVELRMFRAGVIGRAKPHEVAALTKSATELSERLVVVLRRKLLLPTLRRLVAEHAPKKKSARKPKSRSRT
ncbi:MAG TPA: MerR family transcriptional regulator [Kofleriaceae bacterium]